MNIGPLGLLGVILIFLRAMGVIDWAWWLVTAPLWVPAAFIAACILAMLTSLPVLFIWAAFDEWRSK